MFPLAAASAGIGLARSLFGGHKKFKYKPQDPFSYTPDPNDAERALRRRQALMEIQGDQAYTTNEISRAGLLGSGKQFEILNQQQRRGEGMLEDIDADVYAKRRAEALDQYNSRENFNRQRALMGDQYGYDEDRLGLEALGGIGDFLGGEILGTGEGGFRNAPGNIFSRGIHSIQDLFGPSAKSLYRRSQLIGDPYSGD